MEAVLTTSEHAPLTREDLRAPFESAFKPEAQWKVGTEFEKFGVTNDSFAPIAYEGERGVKAVLAALVKDYGWSEVREHEGGEVIALLRDNASITLEPGAQLELSGAPFRSLHRTGEEVRVHLQELSEISRRLQLQWLGLGFHPLASQADLPWVPKLRYGVMREYLPTRGGMGLDMMRRTCTVQANFDYADEADAMRKLRVTLALSPIATALFANSPLVEGKVTGERTRRARVWTDTDPDRTGLLRFAWQPGASLDDYIEWALDVPMFLVKRGATIVHNTGQTFRSFMGKGFSGTRATQEDWLSHLATLFPEVRLKKTLEVRGTDAQRSPEWVVAIPALWKGLIYDARALDAAEAVASGIEFDAAQAARLDVADRGLQAELHGRPVRSWAEQIVEIAVDGLKRIDERDENGRDESTFLSAVQEALQRGLTPADMLRAELGESPSPERIVQATRL